MAGQGLFMKPLAGQGDFSLCDLGGGGGQEFF